MTGETKKNLFVSYLPMAMQILVTIVITPLLIKTFGQDKYGVYVLIVTIISYFTLSNLGIPQTLTREIIEARHRRDLKRINSMINSILVYYLAAVIIVILVIYLFFYQNLAGVASLIVNDRQHLDLFSLGMLLIAVSFGVNLLSQIFEAITVADNKIYVVKFVKFIQVSVTGIANFVVLILIGTVEAVILVHVIVSGLTLIALLKLSRKYLFYSFDFSARDWGVFKRMLPSSFWYLMSGVSVILIFQVDTIVISSFIGLSAVAVYSLMYRFTDIVRQVLSTIPNILFPKVSRMLAEQQYKEIRILHNRVLAGMIALAIVGGILLYTIGYDLFRLWIGEENAGSRNLFLYFVFFSMLFSINQASNVFLGGMGRHRNAVIVGLGQGLLNLGLSIIMVRSMGVSGVILATVLALVITNLWYSPYSFYRTISQMSHKQA